MSNRKHSSDCISLSKVAAALTVPLLLAGCDENNAHSFADPNACMADQTFTASFCQSSYAEAQVLHRHEAPLYKDDKDCRGDWENCDPVDTTEQPGATSGGGNHVVVVGSGYHGGTSTYYQPRMNGFLLGNTKADTSPGAPPPARFVESVSRGADGNLHTMATKTAFESFGRVYSYTHVPEIHSGTIATRPVLPTGTNIIRGGFSTGARAFSFAG